MTIKETEEKLQEIADSRDSSELKTKVAKMLIDQLEGYETGEDMFSDVGQGCSSGIISGLIYYKDTHQFARDYLEEILELFAVSQFDFNLRMPENEDQLNWLAWFGFEQTAFDIQSELGL